MNIFEKLVEGRKQVVYLQKDTKGYNYQYVSGANVIGALREKLDELKLLLITRIDSHNMEKVGNEFVINAVMTFSWVDAETGEHIDVPWFGFGSDTDPSKASGKLLTYEERYFLLKAFTVPTDKDDPDAFQQKNGVSKPEPAKQQKKTVREQPDHEAWKTLTVDYKEFPNEYAQACVNLGIDRPFKIAEAENLHAEISKLIDAQN